MKNIKVKIPFLSVSCNVLNFSFQILLLSFLANIKGDIAFDFCQLRATDGGDLTQGLTGGDSHSNELCCNISTLETLLNLNLSKQFTFDI